MEMNTTLCHELTVLSLLLRAKNKLGLISAVAAKARQHQCVFSSLQLFILHIFLKTVPCQLSGARLRDCAIETSSNFGRAQ